MSKCDVCGREDLNTIVCSSSCGATSFSYCPSCLQNGIEPYSALVGMGLFWADINKTYKQQILIPSLNFHGKTKEQFDADVEADYLNYLEYLKSQKEQETTDNTKDTEELPFG